MVENQNVSRSHATHAADIDVGLRAYMLKVYNYMGIGLVVTAATAFIGAYSGLYNAIVGTPLYWGVVLSPLIMVLVLSFGINRIKTSTAQILFWAYAGLMGLSLSYVLLAYTGASLTTTFLVTAATFGSLSLYGYTTKRALSGFGTFLFMGLIGIVIAMIVNMFLQNAALDFVVSVLGVLIFAGLTAYDTQSIKQGYYTTRGTAVAEKSAIIGALRLYLDFINLFLFLLRFMGNRD